MPYQDQISSVSLIADHIRETANEAISSLETFHNETTPSPARKSAWTTVYQLNRVFTFIELPAAATLTKDICNIIKGLSEPFHEEDEDRLEAIIYSLSLLERYIDFICNKPFDLPQLLFTPINDLRQTAHMPYFPESSFFDVNHRKVRENFDSSHRLDNYEIVKTSRRLRQMFQMGMIEIIRKTNIPGGLSMMLRATKRFDKQCGSPNAPNMWWIAAGAIEGFHDGGLVLSPERIKLFTKLDLQMRELGQVNHNINYKMREKAEQLSFDLLYLVSLSDADEPLTKQLKKHFGLPDTGLTERNLTQEFLLLKGLKEDDYQSLFSTILEDILGLQTDLIAEDYEPESNELTHLLHQLKQLHSLFSVLEFENIEISLKEAVERVELTVNKNVALPDSDRQFISGVLSKIESILNDQSGGRPGAKTSLNRMKLSKEQLDSCKNGRKQIHQVINQLENYSLKDHDPELLSSMPASLERAANEMVTLDNQDMVDLINELINLADKYFLKEPATLQALELLADILCSIEFYLETMEKQHTPSSKIYEFADENLARLKAHLHL
ncbi:hypothetical protein [Pleionea sediminis]|uniref:hypothetical protein n=1 Tax=Pleionea sediminis TaxID=2569479 RepID=UPI0011857475|nr:hypothetical protein [Pleionea sediminis]